MKKTVLGFILLLIAPHALAGQPLSFATADGALRGYDPVAYFTSGEPTPGRNQYSTQWQGAIYKFDNADNLARFRSDPKRYAPQYGGYCAYAVARGATASTDPEAWTIVNGRLYLNFSPAVRERWKRDIPGNIRAADNNWPGVLD